MSTLKVNNVTDLGDDAIVTAGALVGAGKILQVVSTTTGTAFSTSSTSFQDTSCAATITPTSATSQILVMATGTLNKSANVNDVFIRLFRGTVSGTSLGPSDGGKFFASSSVGIVVAFATSFLDSPNTTSATTYTLGIRIDGSGTGTVERNQTMTLMEVAG